MAQKIQITILVLIIIFSGVFIAYKTVRPEKSPPAAPVVLQEPTEEERMQILIDMTTASDTTAEPSAEEMKRIIELTTAPAPKKASLSNQ